VGLRMAQRRNLLTAKKVQAESRTGRHADGGGLYLVVSKAAKKDDKPNKRWAFIYSRGGRDQNKRTELGIGSAADVTLAEAREKAAAMQAAIRRGEDPKAARAPATIVTFGDAADAYLAAMAPSWRNEKHVAQWRMTLGDAYCKSLRSRPVAEVAVADVLSVLSPIWGKVPETASRLRGRIEAVLDAAAVLNQRAGDNPARWKGHLQKLLPPRRKLSRGHHAAMPWDDVPAYVQSLRDRPAMSALALEFTILTAARTGETIGARWPEIDGDIWTVPAERMKANKRHRVPLVPRCIEILAELRKLGGEYIFPGAKEGQPLSNMAMLEMVKPLGITVHGFRSSFRDWAAEATEYPADLIEMALSHAISNEVEAAYRRGDMLDRRRPVMLAWERHCLGNSKPVVDNLAVLPDDQDRSNHEDRQADTDR